jgi:hypothetical protein
MRREEGERRERFVASQTALYHGARDIALATHDGSAAASAIVELAQTLHPNDSVARGAVLESESASLHEYWRERGSSVHLSAELSLRHEVLSLAKNSDEVRRAQAFLSNAGTALANSLLTTDAAHPNNVARSLLSEASILISSGDHEVALRKILEAKHLQSSGTDDGDSILMRIDKELVCYEALEDDTALINALDEGISHCEELIDEESVSDFRQPTFSRIRSLIDGWAPESGRQVLTAHGLDMILSEKYTLDYRLHQANMILHRVVKSNSYSNKEMMINAVARCSQILYGAEHKRLLDQSEYYREKYMIFDEARNDEYSAVLLQKCIRVKSNAKLIRERALHFIFELQKFVMHADHDLDRRNKAYAEVLACLDYALADDILVRHRQFMNLLFCFVVCIDNRPSESPPKSFYEDLGSYLGEKPLASGGPFQRLVAYVGEMIRLTGAPAYPELPRRLLERISADEEP